MKKPMRILRILFYFFENFHGVLDDHIEYLFKKLSTFLTSGDDSLLKLNNKIM